MAEPDFDVVVVGAGPAGACAAIEAARAGLRTLLLERGPFPGSKNMFGGVIYPRILDDLLPRWWNEAPIQRWVTRRSTMILTDTRALTLDYRSDAWAAPPYNGATAYRPEFDRWLAGHAVDAGANLLCDTTATGLLRGSSRRRGRTTGFTAKRAGLYGRPKAKNFTLGVKETLALPRSVIDERFGVRDRDGVDIEIIGCTGAVSGGGFVYTNLDTLAVGVVLKVTELAAQSTRAEDII